MARQHIANRAIAWLPFSLRRIRGEEDLARACAVRAEAYGRLLPELAASMRTPDAIDRAPGTVVFLCECKHSRRAIGSARIQFSASGDLLIEQSVALPAPIAGRRLAEITRLSVVPGADRRVSLALMKASYLVSLRADVELLVIGARREVLVRQYRRLGFVDVFSDGQMVPLRHAGHLPHRILCFDVPCAEPAWRTGGHPLYGFMVGTEHPDLRPFDDQPAPTKKPSTSR